MANSKSEDNVITFKVDNFSSLKEKVSSPPKIIRNLPWRIEVEPKKKDDQNVPKYVGIFLRCDGLKSSSWSCKASIEFQTVNHMDPDKIFSYEIADPCPFHSGLDTAWGDPDYQHWSEVCNPNEGFIKNGSVTFKVKVSVYDLWEEEGWRPEANLIFMPTPFLCDRIRMEEFSDFTIKTMERSFKCHKVMLATRSEVFEKMLKLDCVETKKNEVLIEDFEDHVVDSFVEFIYYGRLQDRDDYSVDLLKMAHKYEVVDLINACAMYLASHVTEENVAELWEVSETLEIPELINAVHDFLQKASNWEDEIPGIEDVIKRHPKYLIKLYKINVKELDLEQAQNLKILKNLKKGCKCLAHS